MNRTQFTFYESFYQSLQRIRSREDRAEVYDAICAYALYGTEPDLPEMSDTAAVAMMLIRPNLDASRRKAESGQLGGSRTKAKREDPAREGENKKEKENKIENEIESEIEREGEAGGGNEGPRPLADQRPQVLPTFEQVEDAARERGCPQLARDFYDYYSAAGWRDMDGKPVHSWHQKLVAWQLREQRKKGGQSWASLAAEMGEGL